MVHRIEIKISLMQNFSTERDDDDDDIEVIFCQIKIIRCYFGPDHYLNFFHFAAVLRWTNISKLVPIKWNVRRSLR